MRAQGKQSSQVALAQQLFEEYYTRCFWYMSPQARIGTDTVPLIAKGLRTYGGRSGFLAAAALCPSVTSKPQSSK